MNYKRILLITMIISLVISALVGIYIFIFGDWDETEMKIFGTTLAVAAYSLLGFCSSVNQNRKYLKWVSILGVIISFIAFVMVTYSIWWHPDDGGIFWKTSMTASIVAFCLAHISLMYLVKPKSKATRIALLATIAFIIIVAGMLINVIICDFDIAERCARLLGVFAILDVLGTITTPLLNKLKGK